MPRFRAKHRRAVYRPAKARDLIPGRPAVLDDLLLTSGVFPDYLEHAVEVHGGRLTAEEADSLLDGGVAHRESGPPRIGTDRWIVWADRERGRGAESKFGSARRKKERLNLPVVPDDGPHCDRPGASVALHDAGE